MRTINDVKKDIENNYAAFMELKDSIKFFSGEEKALYLKLLGAYCADYLTGLFASEELERELIQLGKDIPFEHKRKRDTNRILIVMTEAASIGGHTGLVNNLITTDSNHNYSLVFTDKHSMDNIPDYLCKHVSKSGGVIYCLGNSSYKSDVVELLRISDGFGYILLFQHMYDVLPVIAYSNDSFKTPVLLYQHSDHKFTYGFSIADRVLFLRDYDKNRGIDRNGIDSNICSKLCIFGGGVDVEACPKKLSESERIRVRKDYGIGIKDKLIVSMGYEERYEPIIGYSFFEYMKEVIEKGDERVKFLIIGPSPDSIRWKGIMDSFKGQIATLGIKSKDEAMRIIGSSDLFIVSFPMPSAGMIPASKMGIEVLALSLTGITREQLGNRAKNTVEELVDSTINILYGNSKKQLLDTISNITEQEFLQKWRDTLLETDKRHRNHIFTPNRKIEQYELIYWQNLKHSVGENLYAVINDVNAMLGENNEVLQLLYEIDDRYRLGIRNYIKRRDSSSMLVRKYGYLFSVTTKWIRIKQRNISISGFFEERGWRYLAIYGMGHLGKLLIEELKNSNVEVVYGIDRRFDEIESEINVYSQDACLKKVDVIVNTSATDNDRILKGLTSNPVDSIISIGEVIDTLYKNILNN